MHKNKHLLNVYYFCKGGKGCKSCEGDSSLMQATLIKLLLECELESPDKV